LEVSNTHTKTHVLKLWNFDFVMLIFGWFLLICREVMFSKLSFVSMLTINLRFLTSILFLFLGFLCGCGWVI
jgi:hypothetical protein